MTPFCVIYYQSKHNLSALGHRELENRKAIHAAHRNAVNSEEFRPMMTSYIAEGIY
jgi:hypothetical protein